jgi:probable HAF family extracellular repeat protein
MTLKGVVQAGFVFAMLAPFGANAQQYAVTYFGGPLTYGTGLNNSGQVTGSTQVVTDTSPGGATQAFLYTGGSTEDLGTLGGANSVGKAINNSGQVAGESQIAGATPYYHAFLFSNGTMQDLGTLSGPISFAFGINDSGQVTGSSAIGTGVLHAFPYSNGLMQDLGTLGGSNSQGLGINDIGQVTGFSDSPGGTHAFLYSEGYSINDSGEVTGYSDITGNASFHAFLYTAGSMQDLGTLPGGTDSIGNFVANGGEVTGHSTTSGNNFATDHAFLYSNGHMVDLNSEIGSAASLYTLTSGVAINNSGEILASGTIDATGATVVFLLTPTETSGVPLPGSAWLMLSGVGGLGALARRRITA